MRIGVLPDLRGHAGGIYQYSITMLQALQGWSRDGARHEFHVFADDAASHPSLKSTPASWFTHELRPPSLRRTARQVLDRIGLADTVRQSLGRIRAPGGPLDPDQVQRRDAEAQWFGSFGMELMLYPTPQALAFETGLPYVMAIHDLQHRIQPEFPEVSADGELERREYLFRNGARYATLLLADSEVGKEEIIEFYGEFGVTPDRVKVLPFLPAAYLPHDVPASDRARVRKTFALPERYVFYPAQFWPHKNHARIVEALVRLRCDHDLDIPLVLCGSSEGAIRAAEFRRVQQIAESGGISGQIRQLGYVPDADMGALYAEASALMMPTFFGPTNIPVLEAWAFGCPVITSDIRGAREQAGDAALLVDPRSVDAIAEALHRLWTEPGLPAELAARGRARLAQYTPEDFRQRLTAIIDEAVDRTRSGEHVHAAH